MKLLPPLIAASYALAITLASTQVASRAPESRAVTLWSSYFGGLGAAGPTDRRPKAAILKDLRALPEQELLELRTYLLGLPADDGRGLDLLGQLLPNGHQAFLLHALASKGWFRPAVKALAALNDASLVAPILIRAKSEGIPGVWSLAPLAKPEFLTAVQREHRLDPTNGSAFVLGHFGHLAELDIRQCAATPADRIRWAALAGLSLSDDKEGLALLVELADLDEIGEAGFVTDRFTAEGIRHVDTLLRWLKASPGKEHVAAHALVQIPSPRGILAVLTKYQDEPFENVIAARAAKTSPPTARSFVADRLSDGTRQQKLNALLVAHHLYGYDRSTRGIEHPLLKFLLAVSRDTDADVRREASRLISDFANDAEYPEGKKAVRRLVEMMNDPEPRVRAEAAGQASQYPSPKVLELLKRMAANPREDSRTRETAARAADSLENRLRRMPGTGRKPISF